MAPPLDIKRNTMFYRMQVNNNQTKGLAWKTVLAIEKHLTLRHAPETPEGERLRKAIGCSLEIYKALYHRGAREGTLLNMVQAYIAMMISTTNLTVDTRLWWANTIKPHFEKLQRDLFASQMENQLMRYRFAPMGRIVSDTELQLEEAVAQNKTLEISNKRLHGLVKRANHHNQLLIESEAAALKEAEMVAGGARPGSMAMLKSFQTVVWRLNKIEEAVVAFASADEDLDPLRTSLAKTLQALAGAMRDNIKGAMILKNAIVYNNNLKAHAIYLLEENKELKLYHWKAEHYYVVRNQRDKYELLADKLEVEKQTLQTKLAGAIESLKAFEGFKEDSKELTERIKAKAFEDARKPLLDQIMEDTRKMDDLKASFVELRDECYYYVDILKSEFGRWCGDIEAREVRIEELEKRLESTERERDNINQAMVDFEGVFGVLDAELAKVKEERNELKSTLDGLKASNFELGKEIIDLTHENTELNKKVTQMRVQLETAGRLIQRCNSRNLELEKSIMEHISNHDNDRTFRLGLKDQLKVANAEIEGLEGRNFDLVRELELLTEERDTVEEENRELREMETELEGKLEDNLAVMESLRAALSAKEDEVDGLQASVQRWVEYAVKINGEKETLKAAYQVLKASHQVQSIRIGELNEAVGIANKQMDSANKHIDRFEIEAKQLRDEKEELENEVDLLRSNCNDLQQRQAQSIQLKDDNEVLTSLNEELLSARSESDDRSRRTQAKNDQLKNDMAALTEANEKLSDRAKLCEEENTQIMVQKMDLQASSEDMRNDMAEVQTINAEQAVTIKELQARLQAACETQVEMQNLKNENEELLKENQGYEHTIQTMRLQGQAAPYNPEGINLSSHDGTFITAQANASTLNATAANDGIFDGDSLSEAGFDLLSDGLTPGLTEVQLLARIQDLEDRLRSQTAEYRGALDSRDAVYRTKISALYTRIEELQAKNTALGGDSLYTDTALATDSSEYESGEPLNDRDALLLQEATAFQPIVGRDTLQAQIQKLELDLQKSEDEKKAWLKEDNPHSKLEAVRNTLRQRTRQAANLELVVHEMRGTPNGARYQHLLDCIERLEGEVRDAQHVEHLNDNGSQELEDLKATVSFYETQQKSFDKTLSELQIDLGGARAIIAQRDADALNLTSKNEELTASNAKLAAKIDGLEKRIDYLKSECAAAQELAQRSMQDIEMMKMEVAQAKKEAGQAMQLAQESLSESVVVKEQNRRMSSIINSGGAGPTSDGFQSPAMRPDVLQRQMSGGYHAHTESVSSAFNGLPPSSPCLPYARQPYTAMSSPKNSSPPLRVSMQQARRGGHAGSSVSRSTGQRLPMTPQYPQFARSPLPQYPPGMAENQRASSMPTSSAPRSATLQPVRDSFEKKRVVNQASLQASLAALVADVEALPAKYSSSPQKEPLGKTAVQSDHVGVGVNAGTMPMMSARQLEKAPENVQAPHSGVSTPAPPVSEMSTVRPKMVTEKSVAKHAESVTPAPNVPVTSVSEPREASERSSKQSANADLFQRIIAERHAETKAAEASKATKKPQRILVKSGTVANLRERIRSDSSVPGVLRTSTSLVNLQNNPFIKADTEAVSRASTPELAGDKDRKASGGGAGKTIDRKASQTLVQSRAQQLLSSAQGAQKRSVSDPESSTSPDKGRSVSEGTRIPKLQARTSFLGRLEGLVGGAAEAQKAASDTEPRKSSPGLTSEQRETSPGTKTGEPAPLKIPKTRGGPGARFPPALNVNTQRAASLNTAPTRPSPLQKSFKFDSVSKFPESESVAGTSRAANLGGEGARQTATPIDTSVTSPSTTPQTGHIPTSRIPRPRREQDGATKLQ